MEHTNSTPVVATTEPSLAQQAPTSNHAHSQVKQYYFETETKRLKDYYL